MKVEGSVVTDNKSVCVPMFAGVRVPTELTLSSLTFSHTAIHELRAVRYKAAAAGRERERNVTSQNVWSVSLKLYTLTTLVFFPLPLAQKKKERKKNRTHK